jgi:UDP-glucose 4-epimerase
MVVGGAGLCGSHIVDQLISEGHDVYVFDNFIRGKKENVNRNARIIKGDITDFDQVMRAIYGMDYVFHQAALWLTACEVNGEEAIKNNILGTYYVLQACYRNKIKKIIAASSSSVYGDGRYLPTDEEHPFDNYLFYGATKVANEQFYRAFYKKYGLDYIAFRYLNVYGPRMDSDGAYMSVIMNFINKIKNGERPIINGDGTATMDMVYVKDVARANLIAMKSKVTNEVFNVASGKETTLNELLFVLAKLMGKEVNPIYRERDKRLVTHRLGCPKKAKDMLEFECKTTLEEGLKDVIDDIERETT